MPVFDPGEDIFAGVPEVFVSPFPSSAGNLEKFRALSGDQGVYSAAQARAWQDVTQMAMVKIATSRVIGGLRQSWLPKLIQTDAGIGGDLVRGIFARVDWPATTDAKSLGLAAAQVGLELAVDAISAVPIFGAIAKAAISFGRFMYALARRPEVEQELIVPWQEFNSQSDEDFVNSLLLRNLAPSVDWTQFFAPPLNPGVGWKLAKTKKGGDTRSWGPFTASGSLEYSGYGMMPGTQRMVDVVQLAPLAAGGDAVTNVGDFYPAMAQFGTAAWGWSQEFGGIGMYAIRASELEPLWREYWDSFYADGFDAITKQETKTGLEARDIAKALLKFVAIRTGASTVQIGLPDDFLRTGVNFASFMTPEIWKRSPFKPPHKLMTPFEAIIGPALSRLRKRQSSALGRSLACAYVRPDPVGNLPAHAAFLDRGPSTDPKYSTWGEQLAARCRAMREILLTHDARYDVDIGDARDADPAFAEKIVASKGMLGAVRLTAGEPKLDRAPDRAPPPAQPPQGGSPFGGRSSSSTRQRSAGIGTAAKVAIAGTAGAVLYNTLRR